MKDLQDSWRDGPVLRENRTLAVMRIQGAQEQRTSEQSPECGIARRHPWREGVPGS